MICSVVLLPARDARERPSAHIEQRRRVRAIRAQHEKRIQKYRRRRDENKVASITAVRDIIR